MDLEKSLLDVDRKQDISLEQADWETRQPRTEIEIDIDNQYAAIPLKVIKDSWGFIPSESHLSESREMQDCLRELVLLITNAFTLPHSTRWEKITFNEDCVLIFW